VLSQPTGWPFQSTLKGPSAAADSALVLHLLLRLLRRPPAHADPGETLAWMARNAAIVGVCAIVPAAVRWSQSPRAPITAYVIVIVACVALALLATSALLADPVARLAPAPATDIFPAGVTDPAALLLTASTPRAVLDARVTAALAAVGLAAGLTFAVVASPVAGSSTLPGWSPYSAASAAGSAPASIGDWRAQGRVLDTKGFAYDPEGTELAREWVIARTCSSSGCQLSLARQTASRPAVAALVRDGSSYTATFTGPAETCAGQAPGAAGVWTPSSTWVVHFDRDRAHATAQEARAATSPACGDAVSHTQWAATLVG
jgi:hypothetical protein